MKSPVPSALYLVVGIALLPCAPRTPQRPLFRAGTDAVAIDVSVRRKNAPVLGLASQDFELLDNGVAQQIEVQAVESIPVDVSLVFDESGVAQHNIAGRFRSDLAQIAAILRPIDRLRVITCASEVREIRPMEPARGKDAQDLPDVGPTGVDSLDRRHEPGLRRPSLFDAVLLAIARPPELGRRHLVVVFAAGDDKGSVLTDGTSLERVASRTDALLHVALAIRELTPEWLHLQYDAAAVAAAAAATGGETHHLEDAVSAFKSIFADFRQSYVLAYTLAGVPPGGWHTIVVRTPGHADYTVRARSGYMGS